MKTLKVAPHSVVENVKEYFSRELPHYEVVAVIRRHSETAADNDKNLYFVIAKHDTTSSNSYSCWSCWNEATQSLNSGHYFFTLSRCFAKAMFLCESVSVNYEAKSGVFIKKNDDLLSLENRNEYSFLVNQTEEPSTFCLNNSDVLVIALKAETAML